MRRRPSHSSTKQPSIGATTLIDPFEAGRGLSKMSYKQVLQALISSHQAVLWSHLPLIPLGAIAACLARSQFHTTQTAYPILRHTLAGLAGLLAWALASYGLFIFIGGDSWVDIMGGQMTLSRACRRTRELRPLRDFIMLLQLDRVDSALAFCTDPLATQIRDATAHGSSEVHVLLEALLRQAPSDFVVNDFKCCLNQHRPNEWQVRPRRRDIGVSVRVVFVNDPPGRGAGWYLAELNSEPKPPHDFPCNDSFFRQLPAKN